MSSQDSPPSTSKKRKSPFDSTSTPSLTNKRRKSFMSLNSESLEKYSQMSNDSFSRFEDEDTRSLTSVSVASKQVPKNNPERDYTPLASSFGINVRCAQRFHSFLSNQPTVAIVKYIPAKKELLSPSRLAEPSYAVSPVFRVKKRGKKRQKAGEQEGTLSTTKYNSICSESVKSNLKQNDTLVNTEPLQLKKFTKRAKRNVENFLETLESPCKVNNNILPESSSEKEQNHPAHYSENEFEISECNYSEESAEKDSDKSQRVSNPFQTTKCKRVANPFQPNKSKRESNPFQANKSERVANPFQTNKSKEVANPFQANKNEKVANPFSIDGQARTNSQISKKKESFWTLNFSSIDASLKKKKFIDHFKIENDCDALIENKHENQNGVAQEEQGENKNDEITSNEGVSKKASRRRTRIYIPGDDDDSDSDIEIQTYDSLSVNCQQVNTNNDHLNQNDNQISPLMAFGEGTGQNEDEDESEEEEEEDENESEDEEEYIDIDKEQDVSIQDDIFDISAESPEPRLIIDQETIPTTNNLTNGVDENSSDDHSVDLFDSPTKLDSPTDRLVIDLTPTSSVESSPIKDAPTRPKGKPKIKSDTKLSSPIYNIPARKKLKKLSLEATPSSPTAKSNGVQTPSKTDNSNQLDAVSQEIKVSSATPTTRGKASLEQVKCNLNNEESVKEYRNAKTKITFGNNTDESFDEICQDLTSLSHTESITLYKGSEDTENSANDVVLNNCSKKDTEKKVFNNNVSEMYISTKTVLALSQQKTPTRITRSSLNSNKSSPVNSSLRGFPYRIPRKDSRLNKTTSPVALTENRDPRLNRSLSPIKPPSVLAADVRVTRSSSQKSPTFSPADPRLTRGQSRPRTSDPTTPTNISPKIVTKQAESGEEVKIVDPRLRKRKEREEAEKATKLAEELAKSNNNVSISISESEPQHPPQVSQFGQSSPVAERKRSVFQRLGCKEPSPEKDVLLNIIKSNKLSSPTKSHRGYETDDDNISLHAHMSDFDDSDEDDKDSSPRHRKFESERNRKPNNVTTETSTLQQQRIPAKQRIGRMGETFPLGNRRAPISTPSASPTLAPPSALIRTATTVVNPLANRLGTRAAAVLQQPRQIPPAQPARTAYTNVPPPQFGVPPPSIIRSNSHYGSNNPSNMELFYQMNATQMERDQDKLMLDTDVQEVYFDSTDNKPSEFDHRSILDNKPDTSTTIGISHPLFTFFKNQCYRLLREGKCKNELTTCKFQHQVIGLINRITNKDNGVPFIKAILEVSIKNNFDFYLDNVWKKVLPVIKDDAFPMFEKLYQSGKRSQHFVIELLKYNLSTDAYSVRDLLKKLAPIIEENDCETVQAICLSIKSRLVDGFCWEEIKSICVKAAPSSDIVDLIILQCLKRRKNRNHILEVHNLIKTKMLAFERNKISPSLMKQFHELVARQNPEAKNTETLNTMPLMNVTNNLTNGSSFERQSSINVPNAVGQQSAKSTKSTIKKAVPQTPKSPDDTANVSPNGNPAQTPVRGESRNFTQYTVQKVSAPEPKSVFTKEPNVWKLYAAVDDILKGIAHKDYDYIWEQLDKFCREPMPNELCKRGFYQVLCKDVKSSEQHLSEILKRAAKKSSSEKFVSLLFEVAVHALVDLGDHGFWVMAAELLKNMTIFQPEVPHVVFVLISAEIHLANSEPVEALYLLQKTKVIRTNRDEWLVTESKKADEKHRNKVVFILLQALAHVEPEKAVFLYKELMADQYIYYYPIDLSHYADKLTLLMFVHKRLDLAIDIARLVMSNDMTFQKPTYQEVLSRLLPVDDVLVNQILDYAVHLGYYPDINIREGFTTLIIDMNYTEEEIYLMLNRLIRQLTINLGPTIPRLKSSHLKVTLVFEDIPTGKRLYKDETVTSINLNKNRQMRSLIADILSKRFTPPIKLSQARADRFCKIMSRTLVHYLKHWH